VHASDGHLFLDKARLAEVQPGLFFTSAGDAVDFRGSAPTIRNVRVLKANETTLPVRFSFYSFCGLLFLSALCFWPLRWLRRSHRRNSAAPLGVALRGSCFLVALASGFSLVCLALIALVPDLIHVPWPLSHRDLFSRELAAIVTFPYASVVLAGGAALLTGVAWRNGTGTRSVRIFCAMVALALLAFNMVLLS
jgi:hypothetical protein